MYGLFVDRFSVQETRIKSDPTTDISDSQLLRTTQQRFFTNWRIKTLNLVADTERNSFHYQLAVANNKQQIL